MTTLAACSPRTGPTSPDMMTFGRFPQPTEIGPSISSAAASPAKTSALPAREQDSQASGLVFGTSLLGSFAQYGPDGWSSKTSQRSLLADSEPFSETWPRSGLMRSGIAYRLAPLVPRTAETESGLWRTPSASEPGVSAERLVPTPGGTPGGMNRHYDRETGRLAQIGLEQQVKLRAMWPTPSASGMPCEGTVRLCRQAWLDGEATLEEASAIAGRDVRKAQGKVPAMWPTPTACQGHNNSPMNSGSRGRALLAANADSESQAKAMAGGKLNPTWVEWLMGFPLGWTDCGDSETRSSRKSLKSSAGRSSKRNPKPK